MLRHNAIVLCFRSFFNSRPSTHALDYANEMEERRSKKKAINCTRRGQVYPRGIAIGRHDRHARVHVAA